jgi:hypothetical protein
MQAPLPLKHSSVNGLAVWGARDLLDLQKIGKNRLKS